ncbi:MAG: hypothetical protein NHB32_17785 [Fischerella sp. CENA71]|nr:hypothetical protein [Fischerella sp. CENA71]
MVLFAANPSAVLLENLINRSFKRIKLQTDRRYECQNAKKKDEVEAKNKKGGKVVKCESRKARAEQASQKKQKKKSEIVDKKKRAYRVRDRANETKSQ